MGCDYYSVWYGTVMLADHMSLENALIFIKALFERFWNEDSAYIVKKTGCCQEVEDVDSETKLPQSSKRRVKNERV